MNTNLTSSLGLPQGPPKEKRYDKSRHPGTFVWDGRTYKKARHQHGPAHWISPHLFLGKTKQRGPQSTAMWRWGHKKPERMEEDIRGSGGKGPPWMPEHMEAKWEPATCGPRGGPGWQASFSTSIHRSQDKGFTLTWPLLEESGIERLNVHFTEDLTYCSWEKCRTFSSWSYPDSQRGMHSFQRKTIASSLL